MDFSFDSASSSPSLLFSDFKAKLDLPAPHRGSTVDVTRFNTDGFSDFDLDLGCLSRSPSPTSPPRGSLSSNIDDGGSTPSLTGSPPSPTPTSPSTKAVNLPSAKLSPAAAASVIRGSWPVLNLRYVGRGTPVDPTRRSQWGGYDAAEDGRLHSESGRGERAASTDSAGRLPRRSVSPDWHYVSADTSPAPIRPFVLPEESKIQFDVQPTDQSEWDSFMHTILQTGKSNGHAPSPPPSPVPLREVQSPSSAAAATTADAPSDPSTLEIDLGLDAALDLGLGLGRGMNWFELGMLPSSGFDSPSVYSTDPTTPRRSRPVSLDSSNVGMINTLPVKRNSAADANGKGIHLVGLETQNGDPQAQIDERIEAWWRKLFGKLRKLLRRREAPPGS